MSYFPTKITKFSESLDAGTVSHLIRLLGGAMIESMPVNAVGDSIQVMTAHGVAADYLPTPIASSSGQVEEFASEDSFRYLAWRIVVGEGCFGWKVRLSKGPFPSLTFEWDLLATEGPPPSERQIADSIQPLIRSRHCDVLETPSGYFGYPEFVFLRHVLQREQQLFRSEQRDALTSTLRLKEYLDAASLKGVVSATPVQVLASGVDKWACATAEELGTDLAHAGMWLAGKAN